MMREILNYFMICIKKKMEKIDHYFFPYDIYTYKSLFSSQMITTVVQW